MTEEKVITIPIRFLWDKVKKFRETQSDEETLDEIKKNLIKYIEIDNG